MLLGFIIFLAFASYDESRSGADTEATIVAQQVETAQFLPRDAAENLSGELSATPDPWRSGVGRPGRGRYRKPAQPVGAAMFHTVAQLKPRSATEQSAYDRWMDPTTDREQARVDRVHGAEGIIPLPLWFVLFLISGVIFAYLLFFADRAEGAGTQAMLMGSVKVDVATFIAWIDAVQSGNSTVADLYEQRFRDELRPAYDAWLAT